jgi:hypothetical protein
MVQDELRRQLGMVVPDLKGMVRVLGSSQQHGLPKFFKEKRRYQILVGKSKSDRRKQRA